MAKQTGDLLKQTDPRAPEFLRQLVSAANHIAVPIVATVWMFLACIWLVLEPRVSLQIPGVEIALAWFPIVVSLALIGLVAIDAFSQLIRHGQHRIIFGDVVFLLMLFTIVFMQLSTHGDSRHFTHDFVTTPLDWFYFSFGNALRAADMADALKDYGAYVPQITANSWFSCCLLMTYRLIIDILFLSYALLTIRKLGEWITDEISSSLSSTSEIYVIYFFCCVAFVAWWALVAKWWSPWLASDQILWPIDNILRVVDVFDAMQIFGVRLDSVPNGPMEITLGVVLRLLIAIALASPLSMLQNRCSNYFRSRYLPAKKKSAAGARQETQSVSKSDLRLAACAILSLAIGLSAVALLSESTHRRLVDSAVSGRGEHSHQIMRRLGINCAPNTMRALHAVAVDQRRSDQQRLQATETLAYFGKESADLLADSLRSNPALATSIVNSLVRVGPSSSSAMVVVLGEPDRELRRRALMQLQQWGGDSIPYLAAQVNADTAAYYYTLFDQIDPYWERRRGSGRWFNQLVDSKHSHREIEAAVDKLFKKTSLDQSRDNADEIFRITRKMNWASPGTAEDLVRVEAFMQSREYREFRKFWNRGKKRGRSYGVAYETTGPGETKQHLIGIIRKHPESAIDVFLKHRAGDEQPYADAALECLQKICGPDFERAVRRHRSRNIQQRAFYINARAPGPAWSPPDVRQILIVSGLTKQAQGQIPHVLREELTAADGNQILAVMRDRDQSVWIDALRELRRGQYPRDFVQPLALTAMNAPSAEVRRESSFFYPLATDGGKLIGEHLPREREEGVALAILQAAGDASHLSEAVLPYLGNYADTESGEVAKTVTGLLTRDFSDGSDRLASFAAANPLYAQQLVDHIDSVPDFDTVRDVYCRTISRTQPTEEQVAKLLRVLDRDPSGRQLSLLKQLSEIDSGLIRQAAMTRLLPLGVAGKAAFFDLLAKQTDPEVIEFCFAELRQWLQQTCPLIYSADIVAPSHQGEALQRIVDQVLSTVSMPAPPIRRAGLATVGEFELRYKRPFLNALFGQLGMETEVELRRDIVDFFLSVPPQGIQGVIAWRPRETDPELIVLMDQVIGQHEKEIARLARQEQQQLDARMEHVNGLVRQLSDATRDNVEGIQRELDGFGKLPLEPVARMLYQPGLDNRHAIKAGFKLLDSMGDTALPALEVLAKCPNDPVWRRAVESLGNRGPSAESQLRSLLKLYRPPLNAVVLRKLASLKTLQPETINAVARFLTVDESNLDNTAYSILIKQKASEDFLKRASQSPNVRAALRAAIGRRLRTSGSKPDSESK